MSFDWSFISPSTGSIFVFFVPRVQTSAKNYRTRSSLKYSQVHADHWLVRGFQSPLPISVVPPSVRLAFSSSCYEGHQDSWDVVPQEWGKLDSPSLPLFFHNPLFISDRRPPDKWLPYGERKGRKEKLSLHPWSPRGHRRISYVFDYFIYKSHTMCVIPHKSSKIRFPKAWHLRTGISKELKTLLL